MHKCMHTCWHRKVLFETSVSLPSESVFLGMASTRPRTTQPEDIKKDVKISAVIFCHVLCLIRLKYLVCFRWFQCKLFKIFEGCIWQDVVKALLCQHVDPQTLKQLRSTKDPDFLLYDYAYDGFKKDRWVSTRFMFCFSSLVLACFAYLGLPTFPWGPQCHHQACPGFARIEWIESDWGVGIHDDSAGNGWLQ